MDPRDVINEEIERLEVLLDDISEFSKGVTDAEQEIMNKAVYVIQDYITKISSNLSEYEHKQTN